MADHDVTDGAGRDMTVERLDRAMQLGRRFGRRAQPIGRGEARLALAGRLGWRRIRYVRRHQDNPIERRAKHAATRGEGGVPPSRGVGDLGGELSHPSPRIGDGPVEARIGGEPVEARIGGEPVEARIGGEPVEGLRGKGNAVLGLGHKGKMPGGRQGGGRVPGHGKQVVDWHAGHSSFPTGADCALPTARRAKARVTTDCPEPNSADSAKTARARLAAVEFHTVYKWAKWEMGEMGEIRIPKLSAFGFVTDRYTRGGRRNKGKTVRRAAFMRRPRRFAGS